MILRNFDELIGVAKTRGKRVVAVARSEDELVLKGLKLAYDDGLIEPVLIGNKTSIKKLLDEHDLPSWQIYGVDGDNGDCAKAAVGIVKSGEADLLMKGHMNTGTLISEVLNKDTGLERHGILSHIALVEIPAYHKLFGTTDGGLTLMPSFDQKVGIVKNAIKTFHDLGYEKPKIGLLAYVEKVRKNDIETGDWGKIAEMADNGDFGEACVDGPLAMDLCLSQEAKEVKEYESDVAADVDVIVSPNITACNASTKALILIGGRGAGVVVGASAPIVALSRGDSPRIRLCSLAAGIAMLPMGS